MANIPSIRRGMPFRFRIVFVLVLCAVILAIMVHWSFTIKVTVCDRSWQADIEDSGIRLNQALVPTFEVEQSAADLDIDNVYKEPLRKPVRTVPEAQQPLHGVNLFHLKMLKDEFCTPFLLPGEQTPTHRLCTYNPKSDPDISANIHKKHIWEPTLVSYMMTVMLRFDKGPGNQEDRTTREIYTHEISLIDIGCNVGAYTLTAAASGYEVLAVDAMDTSLELLASSLYVNKLMSQVTLVHNAMSWKRENVALKIRADGSAGHSFIDKSQSVKGSGWRTHSVVQAVVMDDLIPYVRTRRVFMKMDIEGSEGRALRQADRFFQEVDVAGMLMEWGIIRKNNSDRDFVIGFMYRHGYRAYQHPNSANALPTAGNTSWPGNIFWFKT